MFNGNNYTIEIHENFKTKRAYFGWYLDWWVNWIKAVPCKVIYSQDDSLLFSHPLAFCNIYIQDKKFRIGFDLWTSIPCTPIIRARDKSWKTGIIAMFISKRIILTRNHRIVIELPWAILIKMLIPDARKRKKHIGKRIFFPVA